MHLPVQCDFSNPHLNRCWEWPQRVSLEAPVVAVVWLGALAKVQGLVLMPEMYVGLGLLVWGIYLADRSMDARRWDPAVPWTARHAFCARQRKWLGWVGLPVLLGTLVWMALFRLPVWLVEHCLMVGALVVAYLGWQMWGLRRGDVEDREISKSIVAGSLFALGVGAAVYAHEDRYPAWAVVAGQSLLTGLFAINLLGLSIVEGGASSGRLAKAYGGVWVLTVVGVVWVWTPAVEVDRPLRLLSLGVMVGVLLMGMIHLNRARLSAIGYRCWVDAALVLAAVVLWAFGG